MRPVLLYCRLSKKKKSETSIASASTSAHLHPISIFSFRPSAVEPLLLLLCFFCFFCCYGAFGAFRLSPFVPASLRESLPFRFRQPRYHRPHPRLEDEDGCRTKQQQRLQSSGHGAAEFPFYSPTSARIGNLLANSVKKTNGHNCNQLRYSDTRTPRQVLV